MPSPTAQGGGAFLSNYVGGVVAKHMGNDFTFCMLGGIAAAGFVFFLLLMPETRDEAGAGARRMRLVGRRHRRRLNQPRLLPRCLIPFTIAAAVADILRCFHASCDLFLASLERNRRLASSPP